MFCCLASSRLRRRRSPTNWTHSHAGCRCACCSNFLAICGGFARDTRWEKSGAIPTPDFDDAVEGRRLIGETSTMTRGPRKTRLWCTIAAFAGLISCTFAADEVRRTYANPVDVDYR